MFGRVCCECWWYYKGPPEMCDRDHDPTTDQTPSCCYYEPRDEEEDQDE